MPRQSSHRIGWHRIQTRLVFDEYDAGRPDVMFVIQRLLESEGKLTLLDKNKVI
jgi:cobaltochelatase CobS